jgi:putative membrane protein insertion efficiency factor
MTGPIRFFQRHISPVDGQRCSMYPTCSAYALQALEGYGPLLGSFIFVDRIYHEGDPQEQQQPLVKHGYIRFADSLAENTFWLPARLWHRSAGD